VLAITVYSLEFFLSIWRKSNMKDMLYAVFGLISAVIAVWQIVVYLGQKANAVSSTPIIIAIICGILAIALGGLFLSGRVNKQEEIHITQ
jgi:uncharacterized protein YacL